MVTFADQKALFDYDANLPFDMQTNSVDVRDGVTVNDITFTAVPGKFVRAYLVATERADSCAAILWVHWLGEEHSNRNQYRNQIRNDAQGHFEPFLGAFHKFFINFNATQRSIERKHCQQKGNGKF